MELVTLTILRYFLFCVLVLLLFSFRHRISHTFSPLAFLDYFPIRLPQHPAIVCNNMVWPTVTSLGLSYQTLHFFLLPYSEPSPRLVNDLILSFALLKILQWFLISLRKKTKSLAWLVGWKDVLFSVIVGMSVSLGAVWCCPVRPWTVAGLLTIGSSMPGT